MSTKKGIIKTLSDRIKIICSTKICKTVVEKKPTIETISRKPYYPNHGGVLKIEKRYNKKKRSENPDFVLSKRIFRNIQKTWYQCQIRTVKPVTTLRRKATKESNKGNARQFEKLHLQHSLRM